MSATKRFYEDLTTTVSHAIYNECLDMDELQETDLFDVEEEVMSEIADGNLPMIYRYMVDCIDHIGEDLMLETVAAVRLVGDYLEIRRTA